MIGILINSLVFSIIYLFENYNFSLIFFIIALISLNDILAYLVGRKFGKTKVFPNISPNKSLEGTLAGFFSTIIISVMYAYYSELSIFYLGLFGLLMGIFGLAGDLYVSAFKRRLNIKDISNIIPGHGGLLDRFDSYLFCLPLSVIFLKFFINFYSGIKDE